MGKLEQFGESRPKIETKIPAEVLKMNRDVMMEAKGVFIESNKLAVKAMQDMGPRKGKEISDQLAECIEDAKEAVRRFATVREKSVFHRDCRVFKPQMVMTKNIKKPPRS